LRGRTTHPDGFSVFGSVVTQSANF
jgi:hypothetical protein